MSIPKRWVMGLVSKRLEIEGANPAMELAAQRREAGRIDSHRAQKKAVRAFVQFEPVAPALEPGHPTHGRERVTWRFARDLDSHWLFPRKHLTARLFE